MYFVFVLNKGNLLRCPIGLIYWHGKCRVADNIHDVKSTSIVDKQAFDNDIVIEQLIPKNITVTFQDNERSLSLKDIMIIGGSVIVLFILLFVMLFCYKNRRNHQQHFTPKIELPVLATERFVQITHM